MTTAKKASKDGLEGLFALRRDGERQGVIEKYIVNGFCLVRWNSWMTGDQMCELALIGLDELARDYDLFDDVDAWRGAGNRACERIRLKNAKK